MVRRIVTVEETETRNGLNVRRTSFATGAVELDKDMTVEVWKYSWGPIQSLGLIVLAIFLTKTGTEVTIAENFLGIIKIMEGTLVIEF